MAFASPLPVSSHVRGSPGVAAQRCFSPVPSTVKRSRCQRANLYASRKSSATTSSAIPSDRKSTVRRETSETNIQVQVNVDGTGAHNISTGVPFLDHMLTQVSSHGLVDLNIQAKGDTWIDDHHTNEDVGIAFGMALADAIGDKRGIRRFGHFVAPLDEALVEVVLDFSGRGFCSYGLSLRTEKVGKYDTELVKEFYEAVARNAGITLHVRMLQGGNTHHVIEASFKAFSRALRMAMEYDPRRMDSIPSSKGALSDATAVKSSMAEASHFAERLAK